MGNQCEWTVKDSVQALIFKTGRMSDFNAKMHRIRFPLGLCPRPRRGSLKRSPDPLALFKGPTSKGERKRGTRGKEKREGKRRVG